MEIKNCRMHMNALNNALVIAVNCQNDGVKAFLSNLKIIIYLLVL